MEQYSTDV